MSKMLAFGRACRDTKNWQGGITLLLILVGAWSNQGFSTMVEFTAPVFWFFLLLAGASIFLLRWRAPDAPRPFRVPLYPLTPLIFCASCIYMLYASLRYSATLHGLAAWFGVALLLAGIPFAWRQAKRKG